MNFDENNYDTLAYLLKNYQAAVAEAYEQNRFEDALKHALAALKIRTIILPPGHLDFYKSYINIGGAHSEMGQYEDALHWYKLAFEIYENKLPFDHPDMARAHNNLVETYLDLNQYENALKHAKQILMIKENTLPPDNSEVADWQQIIGHIYVELDQYKDALHHYELALEMKDKLLPCGHPDINELHSIMVSICTRFAESLSFVDQHEDALQYYKRALEIVGEILPYKDTVDVLYKLHGNIAHSYEALEQFENSLYHLKISLEIRKKYVPPGHIDIIITHSRIGKIYTHIGQYEDALRHHNLAFDIANESSLFSRMEPLDVIIMNEAISHTYFVMERFDDALRYEKQALEIAERSLQSNPRIIADLHKKIAVTYMYLKQPGIAIKHFNISNEIYNNILPSTHPAAVSSNKLIKTINDTLCDENVNSVQYYLNTLKNLEASSTQNFIKIADVHKIIANSYYRSAQYEETLQHLALELDFRQKVLPKNHLDIEKVHNYISKVNCELGRYEEALYHDMISLEIINSSFPAECVELSVLHENISSNYFKLKKYTDALHHLSIAYEIAKKLSPTDQSVLALFHNSFGCIYTEMKQYKDAFHHFGLALEIREKTLPSEHPDIVSLYNDIGTSYFTAGRYEDALKHLKTVLLAKEKNLPYAHPDIAILYQKIGQIYIALEQFENAMLSIRTAMELRKHSLPAAHPDIATLHSDLGVVYLNIEQYEDARINFTLALEIRTQLLPHNHTDIAATHNHLGQLYWHLYQHDNALKHLMLALELMPRQDHPIYCSILNNLGAVCLELRRYEDALRHLKLSLKIKEDLLTPHHPDIATSQCNIGTVYSWLRQYDDALRYFEQALKIRKQSLPSWHSYITDTYIKIIETYYIQGDAQKAVECARVFFKGIPLINKNIISIYNENIRAKCLHSMRNHFSLVKSVAISNQKYFNINDLYDAVLQTKDIGVETEYAIRTLDAAYPEYAKTRKYLNEKQQSIDCVLYDDPTQKEQIAYMNKEIHDRELILSKYLNKFDFKNHMARMTTENVLGNLPIDHALIEFGWFYYTKPAADTRAEIKSGGRYYAYLLRDGEITLEYLEAGEEIIYEKVNEVRKKIAPDDSRNILSSDPSDANTELSELYQLLIAPFEDKLHGIRHLYIAPDGELYKLPFELLLDGSGKALSSDKRSVSYLSSGRDLVRPEWIQPVAGYKSAVILADPQFDVYNQKTTNDEDADSRRDIISRQSRDLRKLKEFAPIPFAKVEADAIERVFDEIESKTKKVKLEARNDTLSGISSTGSPNIIHIATHGFALEKQELPEDELILQLQGDFTRSRVEDPLLRSGLAFAGANTWLQSDRKKQQGIYGTGILFAKTVLSLDLRETDLLVLSACQTALGEVRNGEGIQGLRRAFELSGVRTLICTLWSVQDDACAILMERFYKNLLKNDMNKLLALKKAQEYVKEMDMSELIDYYKQAAPEYAKTLEETYDTPQLMAERPFEHPYYWAGYILQGDTGRPNNR